MSTSKRKFKYIQGFTLLEIQISLVLLVLIMGLLFSALHLASKSWKIGLVQNEITEEKRIVAEFLRRQLSQVTPLFWSGTRGLSLIFEGESDSILFIGKLPANRNIDQLSLLQLIARKRANHQSLELGYGSLSADSSPLDNTAEKLNYTLVLDQIKEISFQYFGQQSQSKVKEWSAQWKNNQKLPQLIKCQITMKTEQKWPEILIPLRVDNNRSFKQFILQAIPNRSSQATSLDIEIGEHDIEELF